jgi:hypothetical protein
MSQLSWKKDGERKYVNENNINKNNINTFLFSYTMPPLKAIIPFSWISLGIYRGIGGYNYSHKKEYEAYKKYGKKDEKIPEYLYSTCFFCGFIGAFVYMTPFSWPIIIPKEIYRLEVNIRGLDKEKETDKYNQLF